MRYNLVLAVLIMFFYGSCKSPSPVQRYENYKGAKLILGSGGGFTGEYKEFIILENGEIFKRSTFNDKLEYLGKLKKNDALQLFENYHHLGLDKKAVNLPGNMNKYIKFVKDGKEHVLQWSYDKSKMVDPQIEIFYKIAMKMIKGRK